jgi:AcrR family transcriptional regulator
MSGSARQPASTRRRGSSGAADGSATRRASNQQERLLHAMIELAAEDGYHRVSVARVSSHAGVSSATFYEQFSSKEDCMLAAYRRAGERVFGEMRAAARVGDGALGGGERLAVIRAALASLLGAVATDPQAARVVFVEGIAGGPQLRELSRRSLDRVEQRTEAFLDEWPEDGSALDIPPTALVGAVRNIVSRRLRIHAEDLLPGLIDDLLAWIGCYERGGRKRRWSTGPGALLRLPQDNGANAPVVTTSIAPAPPRLPRGRHGLPAGAVMRSHRTRIVAATAEVTMAKGYANTTVADIVASAGVARDVFYEHFADKEHAFLEAQQHPTQYIIDRCAEAYFKAASWPERVWDYLLALISMIVENPAISHLRLVECYAAGPAAIRRAEEITRSFAIFLEEGYRLDAASRELPRLASEAITGAIYEIVQRHVARGNVAALPARLPQLAYIVLAPFTGATEAIEHVRELSGSRPLETHALEANA